MIYLLVLYMLESAIAWQLLMGIIYYYCIESQKSTSTFPALVWKMKAVGEFLIDLTCLFGVKQLKNG